MKSPFSLRTIDKSLGLDSRLDYLINEHKHKMVLDRVSQAQPWYRIRFYRCIRCNREYYQQVLNR